MSTELTYGGPQGTDEPVSRDDWGAKQEIETENIVDVTAEVTNVLTAGLREPKPSPMQLVQNLKSRPVPVERKPVSRKPVRQNDPDKHILQARAVVVQNYNDHRDPKRSPMLNMDLVVVTNFNMVSQDWKATVSSPVVRGLFWEVTFDSNKNEIEIDIFKKINHATIKL